MENNFIEFDATTKTSTKESEPFITISKTGCISFNNVIIQNLNLTTDTKVSFLQDKFNKKDWYLKLDSPTGIKLKKIYKKSKCLSIQYSSLSKTILDSLGKDKTIKIKVSCQIHDGLYCLITKSIK